MRFRNWNRERLALPLRHRGSEGETGADADGAAPRRRASAKASALLEMLSPCRSIVAKSAGICRGDACVAISRAKEGEHKVRPYQSGGELFVDLLQAFRDRPARVMRAELGHVADVADV